MDKKKRQSQNQSDKEFDWSSFEKEAVDRLKRGEEFGGKDGILAPMIKRILEASLEGEITAHIDQEREQGKQNRLNGLQSKSLKTQYGPIHLKSHRDRSGSFTPQIVKKRQTTLGDGLDNKIISMYG